MWARDHDPGYRLVPGSSHPVENQGIERDQWKFCRGLVILVLLPVLCAGARSPGGSGNDCPSPKYGPGVAAARARYSGTGNIFITVCIFNVYNF